MTSQKKAYLYGISAVLCWSTVATAFKLSLEYLTPAQLVFLSSLVSWLFLGVLLCFQGQFSTLLQYNKRDYLLSGLFGMLNPCVYYLLLFQAYNLLPAQEAQSINYSWALTMALLAVPMMGHRLRLQEIVAAIICYFGVLVISSRGDLMSMQFANPQGVVLALLSTLVWALYWILNAKDHRQPVAGLFLNFSFALPLIGLYVWFDDGFSDIGLKALGGAAYVGIFEMGLSFVLWLKAMKLTDRTARISNLIFISPFLSLVFIYLILGEQIRISTVLGLGLILTGLVVQQWRFRVAAVSTNTQSK